MEPQISLWQVPPSRLHLPHKELHLWRFKLDMTDEQADGFRDILVAEELSRADRLRDRQKKNQFISARAHLRVILGEYLQVKPNQVQFQYNEFGKPSLSEQHQSSLSFNLSHSVQWGVLAVAKQMDVGVDVENIDIELRFSQLASSYFNDQEKFSLGQYSTIRKRRGFYRLWTRKEAQLKLLGAGFTISPRVNIQADVKAFQFRTFPITDSYICSVASKEVERIKKFHFLDLRSYL